MSVLFSVNHSCAITCLAYSSAELGNHLGSLSSGTLYLTSSLSSLCFSRAAVAILGPKITMIIGAMGFCIYTAGYSA